MFSSLSRSFSRRSTIKNNFFYRCAAHYHHCIDGSVVEKFGWEVVREEYVLECSSYVQYLRHKTTSAEVMSLYNDDDNKAFGIGFHTAPDTSNGVAHILEHSIFHGSRKYAGKDLLKEGSTGCLNTCLNAFTSSDHTVYVAASTCTKDLYRLADVFLDAVYFPKCLTDVRIFRQEGWRYEQDSFSKELLLRGIVLSEMKGYYSDPAELLDNIVNKAFFPNGTYGVDFGGDPQLIPQLTFEGFKDFHAKHYHPKNSRSWFYGNDDPNLRLAILSEYLNAFEASPASLEMKQEVQWPIANVLRVYGKYPISGGNLEGKHMIALNWLLSQNPVDVKNELVLNFLNLLLLGTNDSPLCKSLVESRLGASVISHDVDYRQHPIFSVGMKGVSINNVRKVEDLIWRKLKVLSEKGFTEEMLHIAMSMLESNYAEVNSEWDNKGVELFQKCIRKWIHGMDPISTLKYKDPLNSLKAILGENGSLYCSSLIQKHILENHYCVVAEMQPDPNLNTRLKAIEKTFLADVKSKMTPKEIEEVRLYSEELLHSCNENQHKTLFSPRAALEYNEYWVPTPVPMEVRTINGVQVLMHDIYSDGYVYVNVAFDMSSLKPELLSLVPVLWDTPFQSITMQETYYSGIQEEVVRKIDVLPFVSSIRGREDPCSYLIFSTNAKAEHVHCLFDKILEEILLVEMEHLGNLGMEIMVW